MPSRNAMSPPELARDGPVVDVTHPVQINLAVIWRGEANVALLDDFDCTVCQGLDFDEPLHGEARLDDGSAAVTLADCKRVVFLAYQKSLLAQIFQNTLAGLFALQPRIRSRVCVHAGMLVHYLDLRQVVS